MLKKHFGKMSSFNVSMSEVGETEDIIIIINFIVDDTV